MSGATNTTIDPATNPIAAAFTLKQANIDAQRVRIADPYAVAVVVTAPETAKEPTKETKKQTKESKKQTNETSGDADKTKASPNQKTSYLYAGVIVAPDLSTVKMQHATGVGNTFGILLGYAFGPHWAVETGAYVERKRYYTDGEYFDIKKVRLPPNASLLNVDGTCYMWEIPLNVRYNFNPGGKTKWFATAGLSTYLMNRENYTYKYDYAGWGTSTWDSNWNIKKNSQYPFSIVGLSAGFEQRLGKLGNLRVEPYVRIPLGGIGTGSLPIMSTGINIGFTRRLW